MSVLADRFDVEDDETDLNDLLADTAELADTSTSDPRGSMHAELQEAASRWEEHQHPRWPKGTKNPVTGKSMAGQFMDTGQQFMHDGKRYEIAFFGPKGSGKVWAHRAGGPDDVGLVQFDVESSGGGETGSEPTIVGAEAAEAKSFTAGKSYSSSGHYTKTESKKKTLTGLTVPASVDHASHDSALALPTGIPGMKVTAEDWKLFGRADQENFIRLAQEFGKYDAGENSANVKKQVKDVDSDGLNQVLAAFTGQHGSSSGDRFNFAGFVHGITDKLKLTSGQARREKAKRALAEIAGVIQWDLYNKTRSPDLTVFHRDDGHAPEWWSGTFIQHDDPVMSGLSMSWKYAPGHLNHFGDTLVVMPLAIRNVCMSAHTVQPASALGKSEGYKGEEEVSTPDMLRLDLQSTALSENKQLNNQMRKWLASHCSNKPAGGHVARQVNDFLMNGKIPPMPPAEAVIKMHGEGAKLWLDPPQGVGIEILQSHGGQPFDTPKTVNDLQRKTGEAVAANQLGIKAGDFIEGMQGAKYVIIDDPGNQSGFPFRRAELDANGNWAGPSKTFEFSGGGSKTFYLLDGHVNLPKPKLEQDTGPLWDPDAWANGSAEVFTKDMPVGGIFKVNGIPYEVTAVSGFEVSIKDLNTGKTGVINGDYKPTPMVPKEGYVAVDTSGQTKPDVGVTFAYQGEKYAVTVMLKSGQIQAKKSKGSGVIKLNPDDPALASENLHDPGLYEIGDKEMALSSMQPGERFQGGTGVQIQKPYVIVGHEGGKTTARNLDTGEEVSIASKKKYRALVAKAPPEEPGGPHNPDLHVPQNWQIGAADSAGKLDVGDKFVVATPDGSAIPEFHYEMLGQPLGGDDVLLARALTGPHAGEAHSIGPDAGVVRLEPHAGVVGPVSAFTQSAYMPGLKKQVADMPVGTVFIGGKGAPYMIKKVGPKSGAVATNLVTGKPWPAIAYTKTFQVLTPKAGNAIPHASLVEGDPVVAKQLQPGDQFKAEGGNILQVIEQGTGEMGPHYFEMTPYGPVGDHHVASSEQMVTFHAHAGHGYDPSKVPTPIPMVADSYAPATASPDEPEMFDAVTNGLAGYSMEAVLEDLAEHDPPVLGLIKHFQAGDGFKDAAEKFWVVKQSGATAIVSDGTQNYTVDGNVGVELLSSKFEHDIVATIKALDLAPPVGDASGGDAEQAQAIKNLKPNSVMTLGDLEVGDWFAEDPGYPMKITAMGAMGEVTALNPKTGTVHDLQDSHDPLFVAKLVHGDAPPVPKPFNPANYSVELKATKLHEFEVGDKFFHDEVAYEVADHVKGGNWISAVNLDTGASASLPSGDIGVKMTRKEGMPPDPAPLVLPKNTNGIPLEKLKKGDRFGNSLGTVWEVTAWDDPGGELTMHTKVVQKGPGDFDYAVADNKTWTALGAAPYSVQIAPSEIDPKGDVNDDSVVSFQIAPEPPADPGTLPKIANPKGKTTDDGTLELTKGAGGTTGAMFAKDAAGDRWLVKSYAGNTDRVATEWLANQLYQAVGADVPKGGLKEMDGKPVYAYEALPGIPGGDLKLKGPNKALGQHFMTDALTANWDFVGLVHDNVLWPEGTTQADIDLGKVAPSRLDQGGTLFFRAQGEKKPFSATEVKEVESMLTGGGQGNGTVSITDAEKKTQAATIASVLDDATIDQLVDAAPFADAKLREDTRVALKGRVAWMAKYAGAAEPEPPKPTGPVDAAIPAKSMLTDRGEFKPGEHVKVWYPVQAEPHDATIEKIWSNGEVTIKADNGVVMPADWEYIHKAGSVPVKQPIEVGGHVTWLGKNGKHYEGEVITWNDSHGLADVKDKSGAVWTVPDTQFIKYSGPPAAPKPKGPGDFALGSDLKVGDHFEVLTKKGDAGNPVAELVEKVEHPSSGEDYMLKLRWVANPPGSFKVGDEMVWAGNDAAMAAGAQPGDPSPWKLVDAPPKTPAMKPAPPFAGIQKKHGAVYLHNVGDGQILNAIAGGGGKFVKVIHQDDHALYVEDVDTGGQQEWPKLRPDGVPEYAYLVPQPPGVTPKEAIADWNHDQAVLSGKIPASAPVHKAPANVPDPAIPVLPTQAELDKVIAKHGGVDAIPSSEEKGYGSEWGSGGQYRYRPLSWVPDGGTFFLKGGGEWKKLATLGEGTVVVNLVNGQAKRIYDDSIRVKPPKGKSWKANPDS